MPIFRILNLGNEVPNLVSEFQNALVFLGLSCFFILPFREVMFGHIQQLFG